jgi:hypothetical protein
MVSFFNRQLTRPLRPFFEWNTVNIWSSTDTTKDTALGRCTRNYWPEPRESPQPLQQSRIGSGRSSGARISCDAHREAYERRVEEIDVLIALTLEEEPFHSVRSLATAIKSPPATVWRHLRAAGYVLRYLRLVAHILSVS